MLAFDNVLSDKVAFCAEYGITIQEEDWPCHHLPEGLLADRGEFEGYQADHLVNALDVRVSNTPPYRADWKGIIERHFRIANERVIHFTPGAVCRPRVRGGADYRLDAALTLDEFRRLLICYALDHNQNHYLPWYRKDEWSRSQLNKIEPTAYSWLTVYDREWFEAASPPPRTNPGPPPIVDWKQRDSELATTVRTAAERLRQAPGRPLRVSKFAIAQEIGEVAVIYKQAHQIPQTAAVLKEVSESLDDWAVRRIQWAAKNFHQENRQPAVCGQILARANVTWKRVGSVPIVKAALEFGLSDLRLGDKG